MNITPAGVKALIEKGETLRLIDVREPDEWAITRIPQAELIPLSQFQQRATEELSPDDSIVVYCHHGVRSAQALEYLKTLGYQNVLNLSGGIDAWALQIDPTMPRY